MPDLGVGTGAAVQDWLDAGGRNIVLVEPNPALAAGLGRLAAFKADSLRDNVHASAEGHKQWIWWPGTLVPR